MSNYTQKNAALPVWNDQDQMLVTCPSYHSKRRFFVQLQTAARNEAILAMTVDSSYVLHRKVMRATIMLKGGGNLSTYV